MTQTIQNTGNIAATSCINKKCSAISVIKKMLNKTRYYNCFNILFLERQSNIEKKYEWLPVVGEGGRVWLYKDR